VTNQCGNSVGCGGCGQDEVCQGNDCNCPTPACNGQCGVIGNACGSTNDCGGCGPNEECQNNQCVCIPYDPCYWGSCGEFDDGCGNIVYCDTCYDYCYPYWGYCDGGGGCWCEFW
jgi:hypothetical protein